MQKLPTEAETNARVRERCTTVGFWGVFCAGWALIYMLGWVGVAVVALVAFACVLMFGLMLAGAEAQDRNNEALRHMVERTQDAITRYAKIAAGKEP